MPGQTDTAKGPCAATNSLTVKDLNSKQLETFKQFRENISDVLPEDYMDGLIIKWLRSNNYNLKKAEALFRGTLRMREVYELDTIVQNYVKPEISKYYECTASFGIAKNGSPIRYSHVGKGDLLGYIMALNVYELCYYCTYITEYDIYLMKKENERTGHQVCEITYIVDMENFSLQTVLSRPLIELALDMLDMVYRHYPEIWGNILIVNAPSYFDKAFNFFKPFLRLNMLQRIRVASKDSTPALLLKYIDEDVLPAFLGGKRTDSKGDPNCTEFIPQGGIVDEKYYLQNTVRPLQATDPGVTHVYMGARSVYNHSAVVRKSGSTIEVNLRTDEGSMGLKMLYRMFGDDPSNPDLPTSNEYLDENDPRTNVLYVSPYIRFQAQTSPVSQKKVRAPWPGIYIFRFDNTHSWFRSKKLFFKIQVLEDS